MQELSIELARLVKSLVDATGSIPRYDQRQYEEVRHYLYLKFLD